MGILLIGAWSIGCNDLARSDVEELRVVESDSAGVTIVSISGVLSDLPSWTIADQPLLRISGDSAPELGAVGEVALLSGGGVLVEDDQSAQLYAFDPTGRTRVIGRAGDGPGEFRGIDVLTVTGGDTAFAYDRAQNRLSIFNSDGEFVRTVPIEPALSSDGSVPAGVWAFDSDHLLLHGRSPRDPDIITGQVSRDQREALLFALDGSGRLASSTSVRFRGGYNILGERIIIVSPFANVPVISTGLRRVVSGSGIDYELVLHSPDLELLRIIRWAGWTNPISAPLVASVRTEAEEVFANLRERDPAAADRIISAMFQEDLLPEELPVLGSALIDNHGRIWVSEFRPATKRWEQADAWHVLDRNGTPLARLRIPASSRLVAVRGDTVAVVIRDQLDVQHLQIHELEKDATSFADQVIWSMR